MNIFNYVNWETLNSCKRNILNVSSKLLKFSTDNFNKIIQSSYVTNLKEFTKTELCELYKYSKDKISDTFNGAIHNTVNYTNVISNSLSSLTKEEYYNLVNWFRNKTSKIEEENINKLLMYACNSNSPNLAYFAVSLGATNISESLASACYHGNYLAYKKLIDNINQKMDINLNEALYGACKGGHKNIVSELLNVGKKINFNFNLELALFYACSENDNLDIASLLITNGAKDFNLALGGACLNRQKENVLWLINHGANEINYIFIEACATGQLSIAKWIAELDFLNSDLNVGLDLKINLNQRLDLKKALQQAQKNNHFDVCEWLGQLININ